MQSSKNSREQLCSVSILGLLFILLCAPESVPCARAEGAKAPEAKSRPQPSPNPAAVPPGSLGISFVEGSTTTMVMEREGKKYLVDLANHSVKEVEPQP